MNRYWFETSTPRDAHRPAGSDCAYGSVDDLLADMNGDAADTEPEKQSENNLD